MNDSNEIKKNDNKSNTVLLAVIGVSVILITLVGATFAYFTAKVTGNDSQKVNVQTEEPVGLRYTADEALSLTDAVPGDSDTKTFTITNPDDNYIHKYDLYLVVDSNSFNTTNGANQLVFNFEGTTDKNGGNIPNIENATYDATGITYEEGSEEEKPKQAIVVEQRIDPKETHSYTVTLTFTDTGGVQDDNNSASFAGHFFVDNDRVYAEAA